MYYMLIQLVFILFAFSVDEQLDDSFWESVYV